ncbi:MAG: flagellar biosynthesis protein FlhB [Magnetospirillum sp.]|nr:flagellar biosynthesis protein FlhB [Magnetospirillum sp.]
MAEDAEDKTEDPTDRKLSNAREEGQVMASQEVKTWASLVGGLILVGMMAPGIARDIKSLMMPFIEHPHTIAMDGGSLRAVAVEVAIHVMMALALPVAVILVLGLGATFAQQGFLFVPKRIKPDFDKINPLKGLKRLFSLRQLVEFAKSLVKLAVVGSVVAWMIWGRMNEFANLPGLDLMALMDYLHHRVVVLVAAIMIMVTTVSAADWFYQRWDFNEKMRMTKQEVKDEHKQTEGDPMIKSRLRSLRMQRARQRMMAAVPDASVVVTNPTHFACALKYDMENMNAPVLVAKGADFVAQRIREIAEENDVPLVENPPLARALYASVELDQEVPPEHYKAVAEIIGYVMRLKGKLAK